MRSALFVLGLASIALFVSGLASATSLARDDVVVPQILDVGEHCATAAGGAAQVCHFQGGPTLPNVTCDAGLTPVGGFARCGVVGAGNAYAVSAENYLCELCTVTPIAFVHADAGFGPVPHALATYDSPALDNLLDELSVATTVPAA